MERPGSGSEDPGSTDLDAEVRTRGCARLVRDEEDGIMGFFRRTPRVARSGRKPSRAERRAAERTAQAEAKLTQTEQQIHDLANQVRRDLKA